MRTSSTATRFPSRRYTLDRHDQLANHTLAPCLEQALATLPDALSPADKRAILVELFRGTLADDDFHHREGSVLVRTARLLGMGSTELDEVLSALDEVGDVDDALDPAD